MVGGWRSAFPYTGHAIVVSIVRHGLSSLRKQAFGGKSDKVDLDKALAFQKAAVKELGWDKVSLTKPQLKALLRYNPVE